jgi:hypothetical protein
MCLRWSGAAALAIAVLCGGCGGSPYDTPDLSKGPPLSPTMLQKAEEFKSKKEAMKTKAQGKAIAR